MRRFADPVIWITRSFGLVFTRSHALAGIHAATTMASEGARRSTRMRVSAKRGFWVVLVGADGRAAPVVPDDCSGMIRGEVAKPTHRWETRSHVARAIGPVDDAAWRGDPRAEVLALAFADGREGRVIAGLDRQQA